MNGDVLTWYPKERLLKVKQTPIHIDDLPKKLTTTNKIESLKSQKVGPKSGQLGITWLGHFVITSKTKKMLISTCAIMC